MTRSRARLDLLPLLDVFMVVLFVFATIQEQRLDATARDAASLRERSEELAAQLEQARDGRRAEADAAHEARRDAERDAELEALRERLRQREESFAELRAEARRTLDGLATGDDAVRQKDVLTKLLDRYSVFEVEVAGEIDETGAVVNRCCYREDPLSSRWQRCGDVPALGDERTRWLDDGAAGLVAALRRTKGGNAMTIVRQNERASYRVAAGLAAGLRERFPDHQIYDEGVGLVEIHCTGE